MTEEQKVIHREKCNLYYKENKEYISLRKKAFYDKDKQKEKNKEYRLNNKEKVAELNKISGKKYRENNKDKISISSKEYKLKNAEKIKTDSSEYYIKNKESISLKNSSNAKKIRQEINNLPKEELEKHREVQRKKQQEYRKSMPNEVFVIYRERLNLYKKDNKDKISASKKKYIENCKVNNINILIGNKLRQRFNAALKKGVKGGSAVKDLGCSLEYFKTYIADMFSEGMSWDNRGLKTWHLDHIKALSLFDLSDPEQVKEACNYKNLRPLWWRDNLSKGTKTIEEIEYANTKEDIHSMV